MSLKTGTELKTLDIAFQGAPFVHVVSKSAVTVTGLDVAFQGAPFSAPSSGGGGGPGPGGSAQSQYIIAT